MACWKYHMQDQDTIFVATVGAEELENETEYDFKLDSWQGIHRSCIAIHKLLIARKIVI